MIARIQGHLIVDTDRAVIDRFWNPFIAAWLNGTGDRSLVLLRSDAEPAQARLNENNPLAGVKSMLSADPTKGSQDKGYDIDLV